MSKTFADFSLDESLTQALDALGFTTPTPVQTPVQNLASSPSTGFAFSYNVREDVKELQKIFIASELPEVVAEILASGK